MISPDIKKFNEDLKKYSIVPVYKEVRTDFDTPVSIFKKIGGDFLLESVESGENVGRYSIIAKGKKSELRLVNNEIIISEFSSNSKIKDEVFTEKNPIIRIREYFAKFKAPEYSELPPFYGGAIGYLGYETVSYFEDIKVERNDGKIPDGLLIIPEIVLIYDVVKRTVMIVSPVYSDDGEIGYNRAIKNIDEIVSSLSTPIEVSIIEQEIEPEDIDIKSNVKKDDFIKNVEICQEHIKNGDIIQVVISQKFRMETNAEPFELYRTLRVKNPSPYLFFLDFGDYFVIGSSPEVMIRVQNGELMLKPIAGTRRRGRTVTRDNEIALELLADPKERAEHLMLVDLGRNDLGRVAKPGSVEVVDYMTIERYSHVMHIVSTVKAELGEGYDVFDVIKATFPAGTLTGAPKIRAMEIISDIENDRRGPYGGMVLNLGFNGSLDSCITIRTIVLKDGVAEIQAGAGIVADSNPVLEYLETQNKAKALVKTVQQTNM